MVAPSARAKLGCGASSPMMSSAGPRASVVPTTNPVRMFSVSMALVWWLIPGGSSDTERSWPAEGTVGIFIPDILIANVGQSARRMIPRATTNPAALGSHDQVGVVEVNAEGRYRSAPIPATTTKPAVVISAVIVVAMGTIMCRMRALSSAKPPPVIKASPQLDAKSVADIADVFIGVSCSPVMMNIPTRPQLRVTSMAKRGFRVHQSIPRQAAVTRN